MAANEIITQSKEFFGKLTRWQKVGIAMALTAVVVAIGFVMLSSGKKTEMGVLFSGLSETEASKIVDKLKEKKIPYEAKENGTILVEKNAIYDTRLSMAKDGLPESGVVGYELFDKTNLGMSEFVQKLNYRRALEGELTKTIKSLDEVRSARVHIVIPEKALFEKDQKVPTASVTLQFKNGKNISKQSVQGIQNLVSSSVEGMSAGSVNVLDGRGKVLSERELDKNSIAGLTASQYEQQMNVENYVTNKVQTLLDGVLGQGNAEVRVNSELDFTQIEKTITDFDPERSVVRSEQAINENSQSTDSLSYPAVSMAKNQSNTISNYEIKKSVEKIVQGVGNVKRLTVSVLVNGIAKVIDNGAEKKIEYTPRSDEELKKLDEIVKNAVGYDPSRNDRVSVLSVPFDMTGLENEVKETQPIPWYKEQDNIKLFVLIACILFTVFMIYRLLHSKQVKERLRIAMGLPEHVSFAEEQEEEEKEEELEEIELDDDTFMLLPAELPDQLLLESPHAAEEFAGLEEEAPEYMDKDALADRARAALDGGDSIEVSEETLMKLEIKEKVQDYFESEPNEAIRLIRIVLNQDIDERSFKF